MARPYLVVVVSALLVPALVHADKATDAATALVKSAAAQLGHPDKFDDFASPGAVLVGAHARRNADYTMEGTALAEVFGDDATGADVKLGALALVMSPDASEAWFAVPLDAAVHLKGKPDDSRHLRFSGHARFHTGKEGGLIAVTGWKLDYMMFSTPVADSVLLATPNPSANPAAGASAEDGDTLSPAVVAWFANGTIGKHAAATHASLLVTGTAPSELATGDAALKLASSWAKRPLHMIVQPVGSVDRSTDGTTMTEATVLLPLKDKKQLARLSLFAIAAKEGGEWRWRSLQFASAVH